MNITYKERLLLMKDKGQQNIKHLKRFYAAASRGELEIVRGTLAAEVEWVEPSLPDVWFSGTHRGPEAVINEVLTPATDKLQKFRLKIKEFFAVGNHVIAIGRIHGWGVGTGRELDAAVAHLWTLQDGKAVRVQAFHDPNAWQGVVAQAQPEAQRMAA